MESSRYRRLSCRWNQIAYENRIAVLNGQNRNLRVGTKGLPKEALLAFMLTVSIVLFVFLVPVVGIIHSSPTVVSSSAPPDEPWPRFFSSISYALIGTGVVVNGDGTWCWRTAQYSPTC